MVGNYVILIFSLVIGWILDRKYGDPEDLPHPVVYMGKWISWFVHRLNGGDHRVFKGAFFALLSISVTFVSVWLFLQIPQLFLLEDKIVCNLFIVVLQSILVFFCLAGHTLRKEVKMVFDACEVSLEKGRNQVARIVGRDTSELSAQEVRTAALETLAENLSDGVVAPIFWLLLFGVPGMMTYKMINTMDSMIGYKNERYKDFGCWAARIDDIANFFPARITAFLILLAGSLNINEFGFVKHIKFVLKYGPCHLSPNSGWPEAALAGILNCRFGGPHDYFGELVYKPYIGDNEREIVYDDVRLSCEICYYAEVLAVVIPVMCLIYICI